jgi:alpha-L-rhamnosidase
MKVTFLKSTLLMLAINSASLMAASSEPLKVTHLRTEGLDSPPLVDSRAPRFSWHVESDRRGARQTSYQLRLTEMGSDGQPTGPKVDSGRVKSDQTQWVELPNFIAQPKTRYQWQVRVRDELNHESQWSPLATFETSLLGTDWSADWISDGRPVAKNAASAARYFRKTFTQSAAPVRAKLYLSARGLVEPWVNGTKVTADEFLPGWPDYSKRDFYVAYDVTHLIHPGQNALGLILADGWYCMTAITKFQYGSQPQLSGWLEIVDETGKTSIIKTDGSWQWAEGPVTASGIYFGENYDARKARADWGKVAGCDWTWQPAVNEPAPTVELTARHSQPVRRIQEMTPVSRKQLSPGVFLYDMGQNMVGWVRLKVSAPAGTDIQIRFTEMLEADGTLHTRNLRTAQATAHYITRGEGVETWEPQFTFFGFRYVELSGVTEPLTDAVTGVVVHSDLARTGHFECSNPLLNQLYSNTLWGQKGNFLEVPTDCPQRDERLGWTGDAQVFCNTALYNMEAGPFYRQWLASVRDSFVDGKDGGFGGTAPNTGFQHGAAGWSDAGVIMPWVIWLHTADRRVLEENFESARRWIALQEASAPEGIRISKEGWGDWLAPGYAPKKAPTPYVLIATAYFAHCADLAARMAVILNKPIETAKYQKLFERIKAAYCRKFVAADGIVTSDEQTAYVLTLGFNLAPPEMRPKLIAHLERAVAAKNNHLATGFIGTPLLTPVLTRVGRTDLAYKVLLQETYPGWLFSVKNGATTIWERWDSWTPEEGFNKGGMNSFNHYAYGSVVEWFYDTIAGLKPDAAAPGWKTFEIAPIPGGGLTYAKASLETPHGLAASSWRLTEGRFEWDVTIPTNTSARVTLPVAHADRVTESGVPLSALREAADIRTESGRVTFTLTAGKYHFAAESVAPNP